MVTLPPTVPSTLTYRSGSSGALSESIDGQYHWCGTVFETLDELPRTAVTVGVGERTATARVTERSQQGGYAISGAGLPPFPLT